MQEYNLAYLLQHLGQGQGRAGLGKTKWGRGKVEQAWQANKALKQ
jgi:hypothetical protein